MINSQLQEVAKALSELLEQTSTRIVFAESCTGGLVAASLASIPGISRWLCGSAVAYQEQTKVQWLGISEDQLHQHSAVSSHVALSMALGALATTGQSDLAVAVTGHLGPGAPDQLDGIIFIAAVFRGDSSDERVTQRIEVTSKQRHDRQREAAFNVLQLSAKMIKTKKT